MGRTNLLVKTLGIELIKSNLYVNFAAMELSIKNFPLRTELRVPMANI